jgi:hypothetical protein
MRISVGVVRFFAFLCVLSLIGVSATSLVRAETTSDYAVQVSATVSESPASITLSWPLPTVTPSQFRIYKKKQTDTSFGSPIATLSGTTTSWTDSNVSVGSAYEYQIDTNGSYGRGFIFAGIRSPLKDLHGKVILVVDNSISGAMPGELSQLQQDLTGDGWTVIRHDVGRAETPNNVKALIQNDYNADPSNVKAVFLFGHVPVPKSGDINPDGHSDHKGAWGADVYYGTMSGSWSDNSVNDTSSSARGGIDSSTANWNQPGDGRFDQSTLPADVTLQVGRVDLHDLPQYAPKTESDLLKNYLNKDHNFRLGNIQLQRRGIVDDNFGTFNGEAFAANGWRNFAPMFGANNITVINSSNTDTNTASFFNTLQSQTYLWAYGCGPGYFYQCTGVGKVDYYAAQDPKAAFYMTFGSYFGDWDSNQNYMRAPLATQTAGLACVWAGRPNWYFHHMVMGETIGYSTVLTQNNNGLYPTNTAGRTVHIALMGDPTLHMHTVRPPANLSASAPSTTVALSWGASSDTNLAGYHVYRSSSSSGPFTRVTSSPVSGTSYSDTVPAAGSYTYVVRAVKLENTSSGTYYNPSQGIFANVTTGSGSGGGNQPPVITSAATATPNSATVGQTVSFAVAASDPNGDALTTSWNFGDGSSSPTGSHSYSTAGTYTATATITDGKSGSVSSSTSVTVASSGGGGGGGTHPPPVITAQLAAYPSTASIGQKILFTIGVSETDGDSLSYSYNYGDNTTGFVESHTYSAGGSYKVVITVTDSKGASATSSTTVTVLGSGGGGGGTSGHPAPTITAGLAAYPSNAAIGQRVLFTIGVSETDGDGLSYSYTYGDGTSGGTESHVYNTAGTYTVTLKVTDSQGSSASSSTTVVVGGGGSGGGGTGGGGGGTSGGPVITAALNAYPSTASVGQNVLFTIGATDTNPMQYKYNYGDNTTGYVEHHTYGATGTYTVVITVSDSLGLSATSQKVVTVK